MNRVVIGAVVLLAAVCGAASGQGQEGIATADDYLAAVADVYGGIDDYIADITITRESGVEEGRLSYQRPNKIRIDFTQPEEQELISDGRDLWIYLPDQNVVLQQAVRRGEGSAAGLASDEGLLLLQANYEASYLTSPEPVRIEGTNETAVHLKLTWGSTREHFRELVIAVNSDGYIRRISGITARDAVIQFDFTNIQINQGIPAARFDYDPPASANLYTDFLFDR